jgi:hypothetical protein
VPEGQGFAALQRHERERAQLCAAVVEQARGRGREAASGGGGGGREVGRDNGAAVGC